MSHSENFQNDNAFKILQDKFFKANFFEVIKLKPCLERVIFKEWGSFMYKTNRNLKLLVNFVQSR